MKNYLVILQTSVKNKKEFSICACNCEDAERKAKKLAKEHFSNDTFVAISIYKHEKMTCCENED